MKWKSSDVENASTKMPVLVFRDYGMIEWTKCLGSFQPRKRASTNLLRAVNRVLTGELGLVSRLDSNHFFEAAIYEMLSVSLNAT